MVAYGRTRNPGKIDLIAASPPSIRQEILADSPLSYWPLTETSGNAVDIVAARNGTVTGSVTRPSSPAMGDGAGAQFASSGQYVQVADDAAWDYSGDWTAECFVYLASLPGISCSMFSRSGTTGATQRWSLGLTAGNKPFGYIADGSTYKIPTGPTAITTGQFVHLALVRESGGTVRLYVDGTQVATDTGSVTSASTQPLMIGAENSSGGWWPGIVAHAAVHTTALSQERIAARVTAAA